VLPVSGGHDLGWSTRKADAALPARIVEAFLDLAHPA
jgi:hypothetical protein